MTIIISLLLAFHAIAVNSAPYNDDFRPTATIDSGVLVGITTKLPSSNTVIKKFLGIPFAARPVRFSPPKPPEPWQSPYDASEFKPSCIQKFNYPEDARNRTMKWFNNPPPPVRESEDCLNLNIFAPASPALELKPVIFWMYGGSFSFGSGSLPLYDGSGFAANQDVVIVTINYRTNVFGFPGSSELAKEEQNLGFLDQRLALYWVQQNIAAFGGDPKRVTIVGESAGAGSVDALITTPPHPILFHAAIMQSGQATIMPLNDDSATSWKALAEAANCSTNETLQCLRTLPAETLKEHMEKGKLNFGPIHDGGISWSNTSRIDRLKSTVEKSKIARVPVLIGSNAHEGRSYAYGTNNTEKYLSMLVPKDSPKEFVQLMLDSYPLGAPGIADEFQRSALIQTEFTFQCPAAVVANESASVGINTWRYYFNASFPNSELFEGSGAYHSAEINLIFGTYPEKGATEAQIELSKAMQKIWADFAKDPSQGPGWSAALEIGIFGSGDSCEAGKLVGMIDANVLDQRCELYRDLYDAVTFNLA